MLHPERAVAVLGLMAVGAATLLPPGRPWPSVLVAVATVVAVWLAWRSRRAVRGAGGPPTYAIWGRWRGPHWQRFRDALERALGHAGYVPARGRAAPDILICGPGAPRLAGWTPHRVATYVVGVVPGTGDGPTRWAVALLGRLAWDAVAYVDVDSGRPAAAVIDAHGDEITIGGRPDLHDLASALAHLLASHARGGDAGAAGF
jgi:hypothetical protein